MWNLHSIFPLWMLLFLALWCDSRAAFSNITWTVSNEINSTELVNVTCKQQSRIVTFGHPVSIVTFQPFGQNRHVFYGCHFLYYDGELFITPTFHRFDKIFIKFNETGIFRRANKTEGWLYIDPKTKVLFYG